MDREPLAIVGAVVSTTMTMKALTIITPSTAIVTNGSVRWPRQQQGGPMFNGAFWKDTAERVVVTAAQALLAVIGVEVFKPNAVDSWTAAGWIVLLAALASLLKCLIASRVGGSDNASLVGVSTDGTQS